MIYQMMRMSNLRTRDISSSCGVLRCMLLLEDINYFKTMKIVQAYESWKLGNSWFLGLTPDRLESLYPASNFD